MAYRQGAVAERDTSRSTRPLAFILGMDPAVAALIAYVLVEEGYRPTIAGQMDDGGWLHSTPDLVVAPLLAEEVAARALISRIKAHIPPPTLLLLADSAVSAGGSGAVSLGADAVAPNPFTLPVFRAALTRARTRAEAAETPARSRIDALVGQHPLLVAYRRSLAAIAASELPVLIVGEDGTEKLVWAQALHQLSPQRRGPFVVADCVGNGECDPAGAVFGIASDPVGGSVECPGAVAQAHLGTLVLCRVDRAPADLLTRLEWLLTEGVAQPLATSDGDGVRVRVSSTATQDPRTLADFPSALATRVGTVTLHLPPLRDRVADIAALSEHLLTRHARALNQPRPPLTPAVVARLERHTWPGNEQELDTCLRRALLVAEDGDLTEEIVSALLDRRLAVPPDLASRVLAGTPWQ